MAEASVRSQDQPSINCQETGTPRHKAKAEREEGVMPTMLQDSSAHESQGKSGALRLEVLKSYNH